ncbi:MAG: exo-alpha-sialidase [Ignavibacteriaceae bacterium]|nr:exo-alpha-sialidase [Ignavibacteriaceae bacterium]
MKKLFFISFLLFLIKTTFSQYTNIQVNIPASTDPEEVTIAINPVNPQMLAAGANINYFYRSSDSGNNWTEMKLTSSLGVWGDPCVIFDSLGYLYFGHLSDPISGYWIDRIVVQRSTDGGLTWNDGVGIGYQYPKQQDKEWLAVDITQSQYRNNLYVAWTEFDDYGSPNSNDSSRILFSRSTDHGLTWAIPVKVSDRSGNCVDSDNTVEGAVPCVGPNGEVYLSWAGPLGLLFDKSLDGGQTFGTDIFISSIPGGWDFDVPGIYRCNGLPITACDISNSQYRGNIYVCWGDQRNGTTDTDVFFTRSTDGGNTWLEAKRVNNDITNRHQFFPWMTVDPITGRIYVIFYDRRSTTGTLTDVYVAKSSDGGETFENFKVSQFSFSPNSFVFFGDYTNIAAYNSKIYPIWMRMDGTDLSVWTTQITDTIAVTDNDEENRPAYSFQLNQNYPNPFNPNTTIGYEIPEDCFVELKVYNVLGKEIKTLLSEFKRAGSYELNFESGNLTSGIYLYKLKAGSYSQIRKMILLK